MKSVLHIAFNFKGRPPKIEELMPAFDNALDWVRYTPSCWVVLTSSDAFVWYHRLKPLIHDDDSVFICEIDLSKPRAGYLPQLVWDWLSKNSGEPITKMPPLPALPPPDKSG